MSPRQMLVQELYAAGLSYRAIARLLGVTRSAVAGLLYRSRGRPWRAPPPPPLAERKLPFNPVQQPRPAWLRWRRLR
jgi:transposase